MMINKNQFRITHDKKLLRKIGKQWVTVSALTLVLLGGGLIASSVVTHANAATNSPVVETNDTNSVKKQINGNLDKAYQATQSASSSGVSSSSNNSTSASKPSNIQSKATNMYRGLMLNAMKPSNNSNSSSSSLANDKSRVAGSSSVSASAKPSFNSAYQSYMAKMSGVDNKVAKDNDNNVKNNNNPISKIQSVKNKKTLIGVNDNGQATMSDGHWITNYATNDEDQTLSNGTFYSDNEIHDWQNSTSDYDGLSYRYSPSMKAVEFTGGIMSNSFELHGAPSDIERALSIKFDSDVQTKINNTYYQGPSLSRDSNLISADLDLNMSNIQNMSSFLSNNPRLQFIRFGNKVNTHNVTNMMSMFYSDEQLQSINLSNLDTSNVTNMSYMFCFDIDLNTIIFGNKFTTNKVNNMSDMFATDYEDGRSIFSDGVGNIHISSPDTKFNSTAMISAPDSFGQQNLWQKCSNYTNTAALGKALNNGSVTTNLDDGKSHVGDWCIIDPAYVTIHFTMGHYTSDNVGSDKMIVQNGQEVTIPASVGTHFLNVGGTGNDDRTFVENSDKALVKCEPDIDTNNLDIYLDVAPNQVTDTINYVYGNQNLGSFTQTGNSASAKGASDTSFDVNKSNEPGIPDGYQLVNSDNKFNYDGNQHSVAIKPNTETDMVNYSYNGKPISSPTKTIAGNYGSDAKSAVDNDVPSNYHVVSGDTGTFTPNGTFNVQIAPNQVTDNISFVNSNGDTTKATSTGIFGTPMRIHAPSGYHINTNTKSLIYDNESHTVYITPNQVTDMIDYQLNGVTKGSHQFTGNDVQAAGANDTSVDITKSNDTGMPAGYQLMNKDNVFNYDGGTHDVAIEPVPNIFNIVEYMDNNGNGSDVGDTAVYGQENTDVPDKAIKNDVPKGYRLSQALPVKFTDNPNDPIIRIAVQSDNDKGDMVVGTAFLTLLYKKGDRTDGQVLRLHINGNIGDSDIVINPQDYDKPGYQVASGSDWHIPFDYNDVKKATNDFSRYNVENTFTYQANPTDIKIQYVDTQTKSNIGSSDDLGQIAYDGDTADLQGTDDNNVLSVDGKEYHLNLPSGYHLAHSNNYITVTANDTYVKPVTTIGGTRRVRMPLMKLTLGITPHFRKPTSNGNIAPVNPSSASSAIPNSASSTSTKPSSASIAPSSVSQSIMPTSTASNAIAPSSTASVAPITPNIASSSVTNTKASSAPSSSVALASVSVKPSSTSINPVSAIARPVTHHAYHKRIAKKPVAHRISHKKMAKHDTQRLNYQVTKATEQLNTVEHHMEARKATIRKAIHAKKTIKISKHKLTYLRRNKRHVKHALRRITRNKVAIKRAKRVVRTAKQARPSFVHAKAAPVEPTTDESAVPSVKASVAAPRAKSTVAVHTNRKKLPQTSEATDHAGIVAIILMIMSVILAGFDKAFSREHNE